jgi:hypothetical protein
MALGYLDALVAKENRDALDGDSRKQQLDGEGIAETMRVSVIHLCESKELPKPPLPATDYGAEAVGAAPEETCLGYSWDGFERGHNKARQNARSEQVEYW